ncbi:MAG: hypothetical protein H6876_06840 [Hyphomicrobiaceae bacterium]|nr:hypothetical protein [Hyphomicrobiaceae bacterium]
MDELPLPLSVRQHKLFTGSQLTISHVAFCEPQEHLVVADIAALSDTSFDERASCAAAGSVAEDVLAASYGAFFVVGTRATADAVDERIWG